jgi:hypothetical protein
MRISLEFLAEHGSVQRARLQYAFSLFCAIYGHQNISTDDASSAEIRITYSTAPPKHGSTPFLRLSNLYQPRSIREPAPPPVKFISDDESTFLFYSPAPGNEPDWLGEIFEWVSCADEYSIQRRDSVGRIDFRDSYAGRHHLDVTIPYAAVAMLFLHRALCKCLYGRLLDPDFKSGGEKHFVINTHDVDILPAGYLRSLQRLGKYALISLLVFKSAKSAAVQAGKALVMAAGGDNPLDQTPTLLRSQITKGVGASYFFIAGREHHRDANYRIDDPAVTQLMHSIEQQGMEVALHGSYNSLDHPGTLNSEFQLLRRQHFQPQGNRQHWLRFTLDRLIPAVENTAALYDCSLGWNRMGFRAGACFAFPPYDFQHERAAKFLEIPLAMMEQGFVTGGRPQEEWFNDAAKMLSNSRRYGWGGISLLWHPTAFGGSQLPPELERVYWQLIERREEWNDAWTSCIDFVRSVADKYVNAGLLPAGYGPHVASDQPPSRATRIPIQEMPAPGIHSPIL